MVGGAGSAALDRGAQPGYLDAPGVLDGCGQLIECALALLPAGWFLGYARLGNGFELWLLFL